MRVPGARRAGGAGATVVVPVKLLVLAKSRLDVPREQRQALALAFALDTLAALSASPEVDAVVVRDATVDLRAIDIALTAGYRATAENRGIESIVGARARHCRIAVDGADVCR